jgi:hypothetical protein
MTREWKLGDVAMVTAEWTTGSAATNATARRSTAVVRGWERLSDSAFAYDSQTVAAHPLLLLDPEDREQVERLADRLPSNVQVPTLRDALRSLVEPPKPEEPTGLGAVVEDDDGELWFRMAIENQTWAGEVWQAQYGDAERWSKWPVIAAVRVLSEGVTP